MGGCCCFPRGWGGEGLGGCLFLVDSNSILPIDIKSVGTWLPTFKRFAKEASV